MATFAGCVNSNQSCVPSCNIVDPNAELVSDPAVMGVTLPLASVPRLAWGSISPSMINMPVLQASAVTRAMTGQPSSVVMQGTNGVDKVAHVRSIGNAYGSALVTDNPSVFANCCLPTTVASVSTDTFAMNPGKETSTGYGVDLKTSRSAPRNWFAAVPTKPNVHRSIMMSPGVNLN